MTDAERKILRVLDAIKAHWDLHPKNGYSTPAGGAYSYRHDPGEVNFSSQKLIQDSKVPYEELVPILHKLKEEGFIERVEILSEYQ